ncbi:MULTISPECIES: hypothetical protein [Rhizobium/Agrobacterium group]|uniref:Uncharacterized protein n=2 Tax=Agrobacterium tumefaciens complex TaxID=1183400 RepID=A0AAE6BVM8_AGRTU|nr:MULTISPECIES: hypothetical protein [Rhizobium/Agrobacterium group]MCA2379790.1 hypothetical protein [Agrobacterium tomkonis RTP8]PZU18498.1 MAG: hypothetical protein DI589_24540 [Shinella sp.]CUX65944.1 conserved hypothetical protein [Agrobacterium genomosp. 5 str. CFBP 6626]KRA64127.1 hypothetical protein ASD85_26350 [Rhizobium sp. Root651]MCA2371137.1 hypothetical protein [Agrobacterium tomkonis CIP 111-78]
MPAYTIETTYTLPVFRHATYFADTPEAACKAALGDDNWESLKKDYDSSGEIHVTGIWEGENAAYAGSPVAVPSQFDESVQRRAHHFEILLGLLKMMAHDVHARRRLPVDWLAKSDWAIARGEAILAGSADPADPVVAPKPSYVLARLDEERVRSAIASVLDVDDSFRSVSPALVTDEDVRAACETIVATADLSDAVSNAEFLAAMEAIRAAHRRLQPG